MSVTFFTFLYEETTSSKNVNYQKVVIIDFVITLFLQNTCHQTLAGAHLVNVNSQAEWQAIKTYFYSLYDPNTGIMYTETKYGSLLCLKDELMLI